MVNKMTSIVEISQSEINVVSGGEDWGGGYIDEITFIAVAVPVFLAPPAWAAALLVGYAAGTVGLTAYICGENVARGAIMGGFVTAALSYATRGANNDYSSIVTKAMIKVIATCLSNIAKEM